MNTRATKLILVDAVDAFVVEGKIFKEMYELLERYPNKKIIVTNANDAQFEKFGLARMPYEVFTLKHDPEKTDPRYFETLLKQYDLQAANVIYFEHNPHAAISARSVGILTYDYDSVRRDLTTLKQFLDQNLQ